MMMQAGHCQTWHNTILQPGLARVNMAVAEVPLTPGQSLTHAVSSCKGVHASFIMGLLLQCVFGSAECMA